MPGRPFPAAIRVLSFLKVARSAPRAEGQFVSDGAHASGVDDPTPSGQSQLERLIGRARAALLWERAWPQLAALGVLLAVFVALSWYGLWLSVAPWMRAAGVVAFALAALALVIPLLRMPRPGRADAVNRIDAVSGQKHRPAATLSDSLAVVSEDPFTRALWQAHRARAEGAAAGLRAGAPRPRLALRDPRALRFLALLALVVGFFVAGEERVPRLASAFDWKTPVTPPVPPRLDAWVAPPAYTARAPIFLTAAQPQDAARAGFADHERVHQVPAGSILVVRSSGAALGVDVQGGARRMTEEELKAAGGAATPAGVERSPAPQAQPGQPQPASVEYRYVLNGDAHVSARPERGEAQSWRFAVVQDRPPTIAFEELPKINNRGGLQITYRMDDDYGVVAADARLAPAPAKGKAAARPLYGPPELPLPLPQSRAKSGGVQHVLEVQEHPWAGAQALMTLVAKDEPGQTGQSETVTVTLPQRRFEDPLARALIEQRRNLALDAQERPRVEKALQAFMLRPDVFTPQLGIYLGLRTAYTRLHTARSDDDLRGVVDYLWEIALRIEEGDLSGSERDLKQAQRELREALERGASDEEIKRLMDQLRAAMDRFLQEFAKRMEQQPPGEQQPLPPNTRMMSQRDLQRMLDQMENMARQGNRQAAKDMLADLQRMLENLQRGQRQAGRQDGGQQMEQMLDELGKMIQEQNQLRDKTFRQRQQQAQRGQQGQQGQRQQGQRGQRGQQGQQGQQGDQGEQGEGEQEGEGMGGLSQKQAELKRRLQEMLKQLEGMGMDGGQGLGEAGEAMGDAEGQLGQGDADRAFGSQGRALDKLRQGAQQLADQMMGQEGQDGQPGQVGRGQRAQDQNDPLGRPSATRRMDPGTSVRVPGEIDAQRARRVLEELRKRLGESDRPRDEIDYLERLLRE